MSTFPTGTVTFLFTDIEGSTKLLQELGDRVRTSSPTTGGSCARPSAPPAGARSTHRATRSSSRSRGRGTRSPRRSPAQRALAAHEWPGGVRSRCGWGCTPASRRSATRGTSGMDVVRAARICEAGARRAGADLGDDAGAPRQATSPRACRIRDLGEQKLKDVRGRAPLPARARRRAAVLPDAADRPSVATSASASRAHVESIVEAQLNSGLRGASRRREAGGLTAIGLGTLAAFVVIARRDRLPDQGGCSFR